MADDPVVDWSDRSPTFEDGPYARWIAAERGTALDAGTETVETTVPAGVLDVVDHGDGNDPTRLEAGVAFALYAAAESDHHDVEGYAVAMRETSDVDEVRLRTTVRSAVADQLRATTADDERFDGPRDLLAGVVAQQAVLAKGPEPSEASLDEAGRAFLVGVARGADPDEMRTTIEEADGRLRERLERRADGRVTGGGRSSRGI